MIESIEFWHWLVIGAFFLALEIIVPGAIIMWFGFGGLLTGILLWLIPTMAIEWQIFIFAIFSIISLLIWRRFGRKGDKISHDTPYLNKRLQAYIGREVILIEAIENGIGMAKVGDSAWKVRGANLPKGSYVMITGLDGMFFNVEKSSRD